MQLNKREKIKVEKDRINASEVISTRKMDYFEFLNCFLFPG